MLSCGLVVLIAFVLSRLAWLAFWTEHAALPFLAHVSAPPEPVGVVHVPASVARDNESEAA